MSKCRQKTLDGKPCNGKYRLEHEGVVPVFTCDVCGDQDTTWKKFYTEYLSLWKDKDSWDERKNTVSCILGFFCHMYKDMYGTDYIFVPQNPNPYGSKEVKDCWTLMSAFAQDIHEVRRYIYWVFTKGINKNTNITHFGYINTPGLVRKYKLYSERKRVPTRDASLPEKFIEWCQQHTPNIFEHYELGTMNDLGALLSYCKTYDTELAPDSDEKRVLASATKYNLISDEKLNVRG